MALDCPSNAVPCLRVTLTRISSNMQVGSASATALGVLERIQISRFLSEDRVQSV
ncbi:MAG: hypothetical protein NVSMB52_02450 [Chloroflexota bacterium]